MSTIPSASETPTAPQGAHRRRGCLFYVGRGLLALVIVIVGVPLLGFTYETIMRGGDVERYPPIGQMVDVGGHRLHLYCVGEGSPTAVLEGGHGVAALAWTLVQPMIATRNRVCAYDRAGLGWSELGPNPRTPERIVQELHTLLGNTAIEPPYVLVGHSVGGKHIRMYTELYPDEVLGLVFVDARHESAEPVRTQEQVEADTAAYESSLNFYRVLGRFGVARLFGVSLGRSVTPSLNHLPDDVVFRLVMFSVEEDTLQSFIGTQDRANDDQLRAARSLDDLPIVVLTADSSLENTSNWETVQQNLVALSTNSRWIVVEDSTHDVHLDHPQQVADAVFRVIESAQTGEPLTE
jgi:pimeloyl-ACP methyl ester carboxylesterase